MTGVGYPPHRGLVRVVWRDSATLNGWNRAPDVAERVADLLTCVSVGFVVGITERQIVLAQSINDEDAMSEVTAIPLAVVEEIHALSLDRAVSSVEVAFVDETREP